MKTYKILGIMLVTGKDKDKVEKLAAGTHFLTAYGNKRGGKRKHREEATLVTMPGMPTLAYPKGDLQPMPPEDLKPTEEANHVSD
jgi:hypothetical protein